MRRPNRSKQPPYLTEYIEYAVETRLAEWYRDLPPFSIGLGIAISGIVGAAYIMITRQVWDGTPFIEAAGVTFGVYTLGASGFTRKRKPKESDPAVELRREAKQVAQRIEHLLHDKRFVRDVSNDVVLLLEESSRNWHRARSALQSPYWKRADLPSHFRAARDQSLLAIDQGMQEMLVLVATSIPKEPSKWTFGEMVDEVIGQDVFATRSKVDHVSPYYSEARKVAAKLNELALQVEDISRQLAGQELITGAPKPGTGLEATLAELKQLKQAEDELRQDLRG